MILKLDRPKLLADAIGIISELVKEVRIKLKEDGMSIVAVDPANVALVVFRLPRESFSEYEAGNEVWGVNLDDFKRIMKRATLSSNLVFEQEENQLKITIIDKVKRNFVLSLIEVDMEDKDEPDLEFSCEAKIGADAFSQSIEDAAVVSDSCSFLTGENFFVVEAMGSLNSFRAEFSGDEAELKGSGKSKYSLEYLLKFIKAAKISQTVNLRYSDDYPLRIDFPGEKMGIGFVLAPRVEND
tara:strand:- start:827 stop:1549 length:723 start_codon:yes stop_codon:yes gene_type:complete